MKPILALRHVPHEGLGLLEPLFRNHGLVYSYVDLWENETLRFRPDQLAGLIVLGGHMNVDETERFPFLAHELDWIRQGLEVDLPILGLCLGSQLLAKALGAAVRPNHCKEIGWYSIEPTPDAAHDPLFGGLAAGATVFQWHGDTYDLPAGAVQLARSELCEQQAFRHGETAWGVQFHLEVTGEMICQWLDAEEAQAELASLPEIDAEAIRRRTAGEIDRLHQTAERVLGPFAELCRARSMT
ncbi:MAG: hypothetical protein WD030_02825 [Pirellulales bacterium]